VIQEHIKRPLADEVLFGKLKTGGTVKVSVTRDADGKSSLALEAIEDKPVKPSRPAASSRSKQATTKASAKAKPAKGQGGKKSGGKGSGIVPKVPLKT
ncbi:MAG: ATP-dependent Clp protease ATP-binding subunit ClpA, partial [Nitratireductor sp.]|nr:ATP-dependent Clp protease ATP-binding subunit ClpA [Nitratireductor sp.]